MRKEIVVLVAAALLTVSCKNFRKKDTKSSPIAVVRGTTLTWDDVDAVAHAPGVRAAAPYLSKSVMTTTEDTSWKTAVRGTTPSYFAIYQWPMARGEAFADADVASAAKVVVLGDTVAARLFEDRDPVGTTVRLGATPFTVVAVATRRSGVISTGIDPNDAVWVPMSTYRARIGMTMTSSSTFGGVILFSSDDLPAATSSVDALLRERHALPPGLESDFEVKTVDP